MNTHSGSMQKFVLLSSRWTQIWIYATKFGAKEAFPACMSSIPKARREAATCTPVVCDPTVKQKRINTACVLSVCVTGRQ